jgi:HSP20 family protein
MVMALPVKRKDRAPAERGWDPLAQFQDVYTQMGRLFRDMAGQSDVGWDLWMPWAPAIDLEETDDAYLIELELPGVKRDDVAIDMSGNEVRVYGEVKQRERKGILRRQNRKVGQFDYRFTLPSEVDADKITAELRDGVLILHAPKVESAKPRRVKVTGE